MTATFFGEVIGQILGAFAGSAVLALFIVRSSNTLIQYRPSFWRAYKSCVVAACVVILVVNGILFISAALGRPPTLVRETVWGIVLALAVYPVVIKSMLTPPGEKQDLSLWNAFRIWVSAVFSVLFIGLAILLVHFVISVLECAS